MWCLSKLVILLCIFQLCECAVIYLFILLFVMLRLFPRSRILGHGHRVLGDTNEADLTLP